MEKMANQQSGHSHLWRKWPINSLATVIYGDNGQSTVIYGDNGNIVADYGQ